MYEDKGIDKFCIGIASTKIKHFSYSLLYQLIFKIVYGVTSKIAIDFKI